MVTILCVATYLKGEVFIRECHRLGAAVLLLTEEGLVNAEWPRDAMTEVHTIPRTATETDIRRVVGSIARRHRIDRVAALDDFDVETGAMLREFLQVEGFGRTVAARFRDKLMMRTEALRAGIPVPAFTRVVNDAEVNDWADRVAPPWVLKPRGMAAATGIRVVATRAQLRPALESTGDERPMFLLERFVAGDVYHVDAIVRNRRIVFQAVSKYGRPPIQIAHEGGVFVTRTLSGTSDEAAPFLMTNERLLTAFELKNGVSHSEYISGDDGVTFLETSARVGGAYISDVVDANLRAASAPAERCAGKAYNIAGGKPHSLLDLLALLEQALGVHVEPTHTAPRPGDVRHTRADCSAASADLGHDAAVSFDEGLRRTVAWFAGR